MSLPAKPADPAPGIPAAPADCWNRIGTAGDGSCRELKQFNQCRYCPVYAEAGLRVLDRNLPPEYRREWTAYYAEKRDPAAAGRPAVLVFRLGPEWLALPARVFQEILEHRPVHTVPHRRNGILLGLVSVRGELLPCVAMDRLLGLPSGKPAGSPSLFFARLLVVSWENRRLVFPADEVHGLHRFRPDELVRPPATLAQSSFAFTAGVLQWQERQVGVLDPGWLFAAINRNLA
ncbi:MAG: chemotaxis protein CheW [Verrucomicrobiota bacterium]